MFIGRSEELKKIDTIMKKNEASILIVYGRRRVGKTELIEHALKKRSFLKIEGKEKQPKARQLQHALFSLSQYLKDPLITKLNFTTWTEFFNLIADHSEINVLYLEELQWLSNYKSELISDLKEVWDNRFRKSPHFKLILCGSSPSFMIAEVVKSKALHNRSQHAIPLGPFSLKETHEFLGKNRSKHEVFEAYLSVGGIPEYLKYLKEESSVFTSLMKSSFSKGGFFVEEFDKIFISSLSDNANYKEIVQYLASKKFASRKQITATLGLGSGGTVTKLLQDLEICHFIQCNSPYFSNDESALTRYTIADNFLHFFFKFIKPRLKEIRSTGFANYNQVIPLSKYRQWLGYAFERFCLNHHRMISKILGFQDVEYKTGPFFKRELLDSDFQIDLVFDRTDRVLSVCEIKYHDKPLTKSVVKEYNEKISKLKISPKQTLQRVLISSDEVPVLVRSEFDRVITLEDFFD